VDHLQLPGWECREQVFDRGGSGHQLGQQTSVLEKMAVLQQQHLQLQQALLQNLAVPSIVAGSDWQPAE